MPPPNANFRPSYFRAIAELRDNPGQWEAFQSTGNCVMLAGPGSGKTKTLTVKLARVLLEDVEPPRGIACITYNSECAGELIRRLDALGIQESSNVFIGTIHGFCLKHVLLPYSRLAHLKLPKQIAVAIPSEQDVLFEAALSNVIGANEFPGTWKVRFDKYRRTHLDRSHSSWRSDDHETADLIEAYERMLRERGLIDFDDMVLIGLNLIETHQWVRDCVKAKFPVIAIDEYQDLGLPLHRIVLSLCGTGVRLLAVGDPDQSIYGFAGAQPELLKELSELQDMQTVSLRFNYRSGQTIIDAAEAALGEHRGYETRAGYAGTIDFYKCPEGLPQQATEICSEIIPNAVSRRNGRALGDVAVLYVDKNDGDVIAEQAQLHGIKFIRIDRGAPYPKTRLIRWLETCAAWSAGGWATGSPKLSVLVRFWLNLNFSIATHKSQADLRIKLVKFLFLERGPDKLLHDWLQKFRKSCLDEVLSTQPQLRDEFDALAKLSEASSSDARLIGFTVAAFGGQRGSRDHLNLITLHSAKGMEFDVVVLMGMDQGKLPSWAASTVAAKREPRRLFYVGLTRARHEVHFTFSGFNVNRYGRRFDNGPSEFLIEISKRMNSKT